MLRQWISSALVAVIITSTHLPAVQAIHIRTGFSKVIDTRLDPLRAPGKVASHIHRFAGAAVVAETVDYAALRNASCTTAIVADDKSLYWQPTLYYQAADGTYTPLSPNDGFVVYWFSRKAPNENFVDIPGGLRMITGDPGRNSFDEGNMEHKANGFACFCMGVQGSECNDDGLPYQLYNFEDAKKYQCDTIRLQTYFPSCWNMKDLDSDDHKSHMMFHPEDQPCPAGWGRIPTPFIEGWYDVAHIPWTTEGKLTLSNGDQTGYSIHGDFINGFSEGTPENPSILRQAMETCTEMVGNPKACPLLGLQENGKCTAPRKVDEDIGLAAPISKLPGNNADWSAPATKPSEPGYVESARIIDNGGPEAAPGPIAPPAGQPGVTSPQVPSASSVVIPSHTRTTAIQPAGTASQSPTEVANPPVVVKPTDGTTLIPYVPTIMTPIAVSTSRGRPSWRPHGTGRPGGNNLIATDVEASQTASGSDAGPVPKASSHSQQCARKRHAKLRRRAAQHSL